MGFSSPARKLLSFSFHTSTFCELGRANSGETRVLTLQQEKFGAAVPKLGAKLGFGASVGFSGAAAPAFGGQSQVQMVLQRQNTLKLAEHQEPVAPQCQLSAKTAPNCLLMALQREKMALQRLVSAKKDAFKLNALEKILEAKVIIKPDKRSKENTIKDYKHRKKLSKY